MCLQVLLSNYENSFCPFHTIFIGSANITPHFTNNIFSVRLKKKRKRCESNSTIKQSLPAVVLIEPLGESNLFSDSVEPIHKTVML